MFERRIMKNTICEWLFIEMKYYIRNIKKKDIDVNTFYANKKVMSLKNTNSYIYNKILEGNPFMVGRIGGNEMNMIAYYTRNDIFPFRTDARKDVLHDLYMGAGFFPENVVQGEKFVELMKKSGQELDLLGVWNRYMEEWYLKEFCPCALVTPITFLQPWYAEECGENNVPWTAALKGKKVLVIHPFSETIRKQYYMNRDKIFQNLKIKDVLPEFELITLKAVQTMGNNKSEYEDWFGALESMREQCEKIDFDIAILGCGAYGFPLAAEIKKMGKIAIHLGGVTQLLFGIRGRRWDDYGGVVGKMYNDYWIRPSETERVNDAEKIENGCYW